MADVQGGKKPSSYHLMLLTLVCFVILLCLWVHEILASPEYLDLAEIVVVDARGQETTVPYPTIKQTGDSNYYLHFRSEDSQGKWFYVHFSNIKTASFELVEWQDEFRRDTGTTPHSYSSSRSWFEQQEKNDPNRTSMRTKVVVELDSGEKLKGFLRENFTIYAGKTQDLLYTTDFLSNFPRDVPSVSVPDRFAQVEDRFTRARNRSDQLALKLIRFTAFAHFKGKAREIDVKHHSIEPRNILDRFSASPSPPDWPKWLRVIVEDMATFPEDQRASGVKNEQITEEKLETELSEQCMVVNRNKAASIWGQNRSTGDTWTMLEEKKLPVQIEGFGLNVHWVEGTETHEMQYLRRTVIGVRHPRSGYLPLNRLKSVEFTGTKKPSAIGGRYEDIEVVLIGNDDKTVIHTIPIRHGSDFIFMWKTDYGFVGTSVFPTRKMFFKKHQVDKSESDSVEVSNIMVEDTIKKLNKCLICEGKGYIFNYATCLQCNGKGEGNICLFCKGTGFSGSTGSKRNCHHCGGDGRIGNLPCFKCEGTGEIKEKAKCAECNGKGYTQNSD